MTSVKVCSSCGIQKEYPSYTKRKLSADGYDACCKACKSVRRKGYSSEKEYNKSYREANRDHLAVKIKQWKIDNRDHVNTYKRVHRSKNPIMYYVSDARKIAKRKYRVPTWLTEEHKKEIANYYWLAKDLEAITGELYEVDHIVPLLGRTVSGLHVPWNLQVLPADVNNRKNNTFKEYWNE